MAQIDDYKSELARLEAAYAKGPTMKTRSDGSQMAYYDGVFGVPIEKQISALKGNISQIETVNRNDAAETARRNAQMAEHARANSPQAASLLNSNPTAYMQKYGTARDIQNQASGVNPSSVNLSGVNPTELRANVNGLGQTNNPLGGATGYAPIQEQIDAVPQPTTASTSPASPALSISSNLREGSRGEDVRKIQQFFGIPADGIFGPQTKAAVVAFQKANGLSPDGIFGPLTLAALNKSQPQTGNQMGALNQTLTQGQMHPDGSGIVNFDSNTGQRLTPGATTPAIAGQIGAITTPTTTGTGTGTPPPATAGGTDLSSYLSQVKALQGLSSEEETAQRELNDLESSSRQGQFNVSQQPIAQSFISGQQAAMKEQTEISKMPLQAKLALAQAKRQASLGAATTALEQANKDREYTQKDKEISSRIISTSDKYGTGIIGEYNFAKAQGYKGTFEQYQNEDANRKVSIAKAGVGSTGLSTQQFNALNQITTRFQADPIINQSIKGGTASTIADQIISNPNAATSQLKSLYVLVKNLDPDSAVREGELDLANQTQSYFQRFSNSLARISEGRVIAPDAAVALAQATKELMTAWDQTARKREKQYKSQSNELGVKKEFDSYIKGSELGYNQTPAGSSSGNSGDPLSIR